MTYGGAVARPGRPPLSDGCCHRDDNVGTCVGGTIAPSQSPAASPPRWAALSIDPPDANPNAMLISTMTNSWPAIARLCRSTGWWSWVAVSNTPKSPKIAPDAPTDGMSPPNTKLAVEPAAAQAR